MKKILFATTALVATAGVASAEIAITGMAEMGIYDNGNDDTQFFDDIDVTFTMSGEADNGLTFGAKIDIDETDGSGSASGSCTTYTAGVDLNGGGVIGVNDDYSLCTEGSWSVSGASGAFSPSTQGGETLWISYGGATLTMGDTDGAYDSTLPEMALAGGSLADDETIHAGFNHGDGDALGLTGLDGLGDGQVARFDYAYNGFTFALSAEQVADGADVAGMGNTIWGLGVAWSGPVASTVDLTVGLGYQTLDDYASVTGLAVTGAFSNGFSAGLTYSVSDLDGVSDDITHLGLGFGYEMNALAVGLNWGQYEFDGDELASGWGLAASYDLGGGLAAKFGYGYSDIANVDDVDTWSLGLSMSF